MKADRPREKAADLEYCQLTMVRDGRMNVECGVCELLLVSFC